MKSRLVPVIIAAFFLGACCPRYETESFSRISLKNKMMGLDPIITKRQAEEENPGKHYLDYMEEELEKRIEVLTLVTNTTHNLEALISQNKEDEARILIDQLKEDLRKRGDAHSQAVLSAMPLVCKKFERESVIDYLTPLKIVGYSLLYLTSAQYHLDRDVEKSPRIPYYRKSTPNRRVTEIEIGK